MNITQNPNDFCYEVHFGSDCNHTYTDESISFMDGQLKIRAATVLGLYPVGLINNLLSIDVFKRTIKRGRPGVFVIMTCLHIGNMLFLTSNAVWYLTTLPTPLRSITHLVGFCTINLFASTVLMFCINWLHVTMSLFRLIVTIYPTKFLQLGKRKRYAAAIVCLVFLGGVLANLKVLNVSHSEVCLIGRDEKSCMLFSRQSFAVFFLPFFLSLALPWAVCVCSAIAFSVTYRIVTTKKHCSTKVNSQIGLLVFSSAALYSMCTVPYLVLLSLHIFMSGKFCEFNLRGIVVFTTIADTVFYLVYSIECLCHFMISPPFRECVIMTFVKAYVVVKHKTLRPTRHLSQVGQNLWSINKS